MNSPKSPLLVALFLCAIGCIDVSVVGGDSESPGDGDGDGDGDIVPGTETDDGDGDGDGDGEPVPDLAPMGFCGDGVVNGVEECDTQALGELPECPENFPGVMKCRADCLLDDTWCDCPLGTHGCPCFDTDMCLGDLDCVPEQGMDLCLPPICVVQGASCLVGNCCEGLTCQANPDVQTLFECQPEQCSNIGEDCNNSICCVGYVCDLNSGNCV